MVVPALAFGRASGSFYPLGFYGFHVVLSRLSVLSRLYVSPWVLTLQVITIFKCALAFVRVFDDVYSPWCLMFLRRARVFTRIRRFLPSMVFYGSCAVLSHLSEISRLYVSPSVFTLHGFYYFTSRSSVCPCLRRFFTLRGFYGFYAVHALAFVRALALVRTLTFVYAGSYAVLLVAFPTFFLQ